MGMINMSDMKAGMKVIFSNEPWVLINVDFVKPGKGAAFYKIRVTNLMTGNTLDKTLRSGEKIELADVLETNMDYLYFDGEGYVFMDQNTYEQHTVTPKACGSAKDFLTENITAAVTLWNGEAITITLPNTVVVKITYTEPAIKGDTQSRVLKDATIETGAVVKVPTFIGIDEVILVDTRTHEYAGRHNP